MTAAEGQRLSTAGDLLVIVPSRGRPQGVARLLDSVHETSRLATHVHVAVDSDDGKLPQYEAVMAKAGGEHDVLETGPRKGLCAWTNEVAVRRAGEYPFLASLGDDMVPRTPGWDAALVRAITDMGGTGFSHPWTGTREDIPEAVVMSGGIVAALGWMCLPGVAHWYLDDAWRDLGRGAGCIRHCRAVAVGHLRAEMGLAPKDATTAESAERLSGDRDAYWAWRHGRMAGDIATVLGLREKALQAA
jgi:hypothetical protein